MLFFLLKYMDVASLGRFCYSCVPNSNFETFHLERYDTMKSDLKG